MTLPGAAAPIRLSPGADARRTTSPNSSDTVTHEKELDGHPVAVTSVSNTMAGQTTAESKIIALPVLTRSYCGFAAGQKPESRGITNT